MSVVLIVTLHRKKIVSYPDKAKTLYITNTNGTGRVRVRYRHCKAIAVNLALPVEFKTAEGILVRVLCTHVYSLLRVFLTYIEIDFL